MRNKPATAPDDYPERGVASPHPAPRLFPLTGRGPIENISATPQPAAAREGHRTRDRRRIHRALQDRISGWTTVVPGRVAHPPGTRLVARDAVAADTGRRRDDGRQPGQRTVRHRCPPGPVCPAPRPGPARPRNEARPARSRVPDRQTPPVTCGAVRGPVDEFAVRQELDAITAQGKSPARPPLQARGGRAPVSHQPRALTSYGLRSLCCPFCYEMSYRKPREVNS